MTDNSSKSVESQEKHGSKPADKSSQLGAENAAVNSSQVKEAQGRNNDMPSGSAGPSHGGSIEVDLNNGIIVSRKNPLTENQALKRAKESEAEGKVHHEAKALKRDNKANTHILKVLSDDHSLPDETKKFVKNVQEIRENSKKKGLSTAALDETAGEMLSLEIRDLKLREAALEKYSRTAVFPNEVRFPLPDIKTFMPGSIPGFVSIKLGPQDDKAIQQKFKEQLEKHDQTKLSDFDREKIHDIAVCDVVLQKYQDTLTQQEIQTAKHLPVLEQAGFLSKAALIDGACLGAMKEVLHKVIAENEVENQMTGLAVGVLLGKTIGAIATSSNLALRGIATVLQAGGIALAAEQIAQIGGKYAEAFTKTIPAFWELSKDPTARSFERTKHLVEQELGPPIADTALFAAGLAAGHAADRLLGKVARKRSEELMHGSAKQASQAGAGKFWETIEQKTAKPLDRLLPGDVRVVKQHHKNSCVAAVGDMLTNGIRSQLELIKELNQCWWPEYLAKHPEPTSSLENLGMELNRQGTKKWDYVPLERSEKNLEILIESNKEPFAVTLMAEGMRYSHAVVIDGATKNGLIKVRDPDGTYYKMTKTEFLDAWTGETLQARK